MDIKVGDSIRWEGNYFTGYNEDRTKKYQFKSGISKVVTLGHEYDENGFILENGKILFEKEENKAWKKVIIEKCVSCGKETPYTTETPIDLRSHYVEGGGQLCEHCHTEIYG